MSAREKLFHSKLPYREDSDALFLRAMRENCRFQYRHCPQYAAILDRSGFHTDEVPDDEFLEKLPFLPTVLFKKHDLFSMGRLRAPIAATSSGTNGRVSRIRFDTGGLLCGLSMVIALCRKHRLLSPKPTHYIVMGYKPHHKNKTAVTKTAFGATLFSPAVSRTYALKYKDGKYRPDMDGVIRAVKKYAKGKLPVRFMGFPSYTYFLLTAMDREGIRLKLPPGSMIMMGGGWKQYYAQEVDKQTLYDLAERVLGIGDENITEFFGAVEHPIMYTDCKNHHFHIPVYSRVIIRDADTLKKVDDGEIGLVNLLTPMVRSEPLLSVMTDDLGILHPACECGCGIETPFLEIIGRVGLKGLKTCAAGAAEIMKKTEL